MQYKIWGGMMPALTCRLEKGESIIAQSGGMSWMTNNFTVENNVRGGLAKGLGRMLTGESLFLSTYTSNAPAQDITLASSIPGEIHAFEISANKEIIAQKGAFKCCTPGVEISAYLVNRPKTAVFGGEGFLLQRYSGQGIVFCELDGAVQEIELQPGETMVIDTGNAAAWESTITYNTQMVKGVKNMLFGGEGLFLTTLTGPGKIWLQTMSISELASRIIPYIPRS